MRHACERAPFYAMDISIGARTFPLATLTLGGLRVNEADGHVRDEQGQDIPGLFAAGRSAIGIPVVALCERSVAGGLRFSGPARRSAAAVE
ncbi:FAD-binding protein [Candidatus Skiveiella danica]|uniref:FAD-binding protein n=1 Tax=Candidatus Skiveiella danica TaxID=3386177 RepID=UPI0039B971F8